MQVNIYIDNYFSKYAKPQPGGANQLHHVIEEASE